VTKKKEDFAPLPPTAKETEIPKDIADADVQPTDAAPPLDPKEEARRRSKEDLERKRHNLRKGRR
jgi:hypothetical protein